MYTRSVRWCDEVGVRNGVKRYVHQQQFIVPKDTHSKYGVVVYSKRTPGAIHPEMVTATRYLLLLLLVSTPVCLMAGYVDMVLTLGPNCDLMPLFNCAKLPLSAILIILVFGSAKSKTWLSRLFYDKSTQKIHIETYTGLCKAKMYGPYNPSIGFRRISTKKVSSKFVTEEHLVFSPKPWTTTSALKEDIKTYMNPGSFFGMLNNEGSDMGNRAFLIATSLDPVINNYLKEEKLYKKLFKIHEDKSEEVSNKRTDNVFD